MHAGLHNKLHQLLRIQYHQQINVTTTLIMVKQLKKYIINEE